MYLSSLKKIFHHPLWGLLKPYKKEYMWGILSLCLVDFINVLLPLVIKESIDALPTKDLPRVYGMAIAFLVLMALQSWGRYLWRVYLMGASHRVASDLRIKLYQQLQRLPLKFYHRVRTGDLMSRATNDIESVRMAVGPGMLVSLDAILMFTFIVPVMFWQSVKLSLLAFAFYPLVPWMTALLGKRIEKIFESTQKKLSVLSAVAQEAFSGIRLIKSLVMEKKLEERFNEISLDLKKESIKLSKYEAGFSPSLSLLTNLGTLLILFIGGRDVIEGTITLGTFVAFQRFVVQLSWPMEAIGWAVTMTREGGAAYRRLYEIESVEKVKDVWLPESVPSQNPALLEIRDLKIEEGFPLLLDNLTIQKGRKIGIVGQVGSGKTTLFNLITRLNEPPPGTIFFEGKDILSIPLFNLRRNIGSVEQQVFLFSESIRTNIEMGLESSLEVDALEKATEVSGILPEIRHWESGFETLLGERGVNLSGGQKQRLALARALVREPKLVLLDDCFSAIDVEIEQRIIQHFFESYPQLSVLFSSHRLSVMTRMDEIWLLEGGKIKARGTHKDLIQKEPLYEELWRKSERETELEEFENKSE